MTEDRKDIREAAAEPVVVDAEAGDAAAGEVVEASMLAPGDYAPAPLVSAEEVIERRKRLDALISANLTEGTDYMRIPGTSKPSLLKPGAEKIAGWFGLAITFPHELRERIVDFEAGFFHYAYTCRLVDRRTGIVVAECEGSANSRERRYRGHDVFTLVNTLQKMAQKRAAVGAVLFGCAMSEHFTQDMEDVGEPPTEGADTPAGAEEAAAAGPAASRPGAELPSCPACGGPMWDNRPKKASGEYSPRAPDFKCKDKDCRQPIWNWEPEGGSAPATEETGDLWDDQDPLFELREEAERRLATIRELFDQVRERLPEDHRTAIEGLLDAPERMTPSQAERTLRYLRSRVTAA